MDACIPSTKDGASSCVTSFRPLAGLLPENPSEILGRSHRSISDLREFLSPSNKSHGGHPMPFPHGLNWRPFWAQPRPETAMYALSSEYDQHRTDPFTYFEQRSIPRRSGSKRLFRAAVVTPLSERGAERDGGPPPERTGKCRATAAGKGTATGAEGLKLWRRAPRGHLPLACMSSTAALSEKGTPPNATEAKESVGLAAQEKFVEVVTKAQALAERLVKGLAKAKPAAQVELSSWEPAKGDTIAVLVTLPAPQSFLDVLVLSLREKLHRGPLVQIQYGDSHVPVHLYVKAPPVWRALIPTTPLHKPGPLMLTVEVHDGRHRPFTGTVNLQDREYPVESIWLSDTKAGLSCTAKELEAVAAFRGARTPEQLWHGPFAQPSEGVVTTGYGLQRFYNGVFAEGYYHRGVDYGAEVGEPVKSPAGARVLMVGQEADGFAVHGNCVGLDHGHGVLSIMMHLHTINVTEGAVVRAGETVGTVGETGIATGPHLHWGLYVNGECVDPDQWMKPQSWS